MSMVYNHFTVVDAERKLYQCHYCSYTHMKNFSTTSNMVAHLRSRHPGIFPPITKRRRLIGSHHIVRSLPPQLLPTQPVLNLFNDDEDIKPVIDHSPSATSVSSNQFHEATAPVVSTPSQVNRLASPDITEVTPMNGVSRSTPTASVQHHLPSTSNNRSSAVPQAPTPRSVPRLSSPPPFSHPPSTSLPLPSTPEIEQLHARLLRAQIEREEAVARYYNALANRANTETALLREK